MPEALRLLCVLAHPDDASLRTGGILAKYAAEGVATYLVMATRGERGWQGDARDDPGPEALGQMREEELRAAANVFGVRGLKFLDYRDGTLAQADPGPAIADITRHLRQIQPQVVVTFGPDGATGDPDHIAISQLTTAAIMCAADPWLDAARDWPPHRVAKLYYLVMSSTRISSYDAVFGDPAITIDGTRRRVAGWEEWSITTRIDASAYLQQIQRALACHRTQVLHYEALARSPATEHHTLWGTQELYRVFSLVNHGYATEQDLFAGLR